MYELSVQRVFRAAHAIVMAGEREPAHEHDWQVALVVGGERLDADGLLCDFHHLEQVLEQVLERLDAQDLNGAAVLGSVNPTAEHVARHIAEAVGASLPAGVRVRRVRVTEAPGCAATYIPETR